MNTERLPITKTFIVYKGRPYKAFILGIDRRNDSLYTLYVPRLNRTMRRTLTGLYSRKGARARATLNRRLAQGIAAAVERQKGRLLRECDHDDGRLIIVTDWGTRVCVECSQVWEA